MLRRAMVLASCLLAVTATGCAQRTGTTAASSGAPSLSSSSAALPSDASSGASSEADGGSASAVPMNTDPDTSQASADARVTVHDLRISRHDGFDRVVFDVGGKGTPGWDARYVDQASSQGSGKPITLAGHAVLQVTITGAAYPYETGVQEYSGPNPLAGTGTKDLTEVYFDGTFEGTTVAFAGTTAKLPFRVYSLKDPTRVVLEIADGS